jgi:dTDP-4-dehydrorhamnose reductase/UDP-glucose 4-epimerase
MVSSRAVYGPGVSNRLFETDTPHPETVYGRNKWRIEQQLQDLCGARLSIVRCANVFGHEFGRKSFFGMALTNLKNMNQIVFDMNPDVRRDFIAVWHVVRAFHKMAQAPQAGLYNLGSGFGTSCLDVAAWIIKGYGRGDIISTSDERRDNFYLDMQKTQSVFALPPLTSAVLEQDCFACGKALKDIKS